MSIGNVCQITVSNDTVFETSINVVTSAGTTYPLSPQLQAGDTNIVFDLTKVQGLQNGDIIQAGVVSGLKYIIDYTELTYTKNSKNQAIYAIAGTENPPTITFQCIIDDGSPSPPPFIRQITVSNDTVFETSINVVTSAETTYSLSPQLQAGNTNIVFDLTKVQGLQNGDIIQAGVVSGLKYIIDYTEFTYTKNSKDQAIYAIAGTENAPTITFQSLDPIIDDGFPPPSHVRQITVFNDTAFDASVYVITGAGDAYSLSPQLQAGNANIAFDLLKVQGLRNGDTFRVRVLSGHGALSTDERLFTYTKNSKNEAIYAIAGSAKAPTIAFQRACSIFTTP
ncbi:hypothetical protein C8J56DRAFT_463549 [Mycena floridula]|nr:hypothetical protein C8J56DRAFT_463549 [Mycena floridula]